MSAQTDIAAVVENLTDGDCASVPLLITPRDQDGVRELLPALSARIEMLLPEHGALLLRGFDVPDIAAFHRFATAQGRPLLSYEFGSTPRREIAAGVYTSTEYPAHQSIPLHNEQSYTREWPLQVYFFCELAAEEGGQTPIGDSRRICAAIDPAIRRRFDERKLMYVRNFGNGFDVPWQQVFNTDDCAQVERYCRAHAIDCEWKADGELRTRQVCQALARHPRTQAEVWFNQAHLFHVSALAPDVRAALIDALGEDDLPRNVYYGDGAPIEDDLLDAVREVMREHTVTFPWQNGDVLVLDNMLMAHGRSPYRGPRKVVVAMTEAHSSL